MHVCHRVSCRGVDQTRQFDDMPHCMQAEVSLSVMEQLLKNVRWSHPWYSHLHLYLPSALLGAYLSELRDCLLEASLLDCSASHLFAWRIHREKGGHWLWAVSHLQRQSEHRATLNAPCTLPGMYLLSVHSSYVSVFSH